MAFKVVMKKGEGAREPFNAVPHLIISVMHSFSY